MFSNSYNKKIQSEVMDLNKRFIQHQQKVGRMMASDADWMIKRDMKGGNSDPWSFTGPGTKEGAGIFSGLLSKIGLGETGGQCYCEDDKKGSCCGSGETGGKKKAGRPRKAMGRKGKGILSGLLDKIGLGESELVGAEVGGKKKAGRPRKGGADLRNVMNAEALTTGGKKPRGRPRKGAAMTAGALTAGKKSRGRPRKGGNFLKDIASGFNSVVSPIASIASSVLPLVALGKPKKSKKGGVLGIKAPSTFDTGKAPALFSGLGKKKAGRPRKGGAMTAGAMTAGAMTAGAKGASKWISHVKKWAKDHNMKYSDALKDPKCKMAYRK